MAYCPHPSGGEERKVARGSSERSAGSPLKLPLGLLLALGISFASAGCERPSSPGGLTAAAGSAAVAAPFDGARAFRDLRDLVAIGPRPAGSPGAAATRALIRERLRQAGWKVQEHPFEARTPRGPVPMVNLIAVRRGSRPGRILLVTHYDTKNIDGIRFVGANDGGSGVALLLEAARQLATRELVYEVWLVFCDGEEAIGPNITRDDGLYGSRALAERMESNGELETVRALILVDMVADADLNLITNVATPAPLRALLVQEARALGVEGVIDRTPFPGLVDDHTPFVERGVSRVLTLIDFQYGARRTPGPYWHTERDDLDAVSERSLNTTGALAVQVLGRLEEFLASEEDAAAR
jgi:hypothetical protein